jgi:hypothetical protein
MPRPIASFLVQYWAELGGGATRLRVLHVSDGGGQVGEVQLGASTFLVRIALDQGRAMERCYIRHIPSARETYVQGGPGLSAFIRECVLRAADPAQTTPSVSQEDDR